MANPLNQKCGISSQSSQKKINSAAYSRHMVEQVRVISEDSRQVELSFSSEQPYERWFGIEILSHEEGAINLSRLQEVGSLLFHHGRDPNLGSIPLGRIVDTSLDQDLRRGKAVVEFDNDQCSDLIFQKVKSGAIRGVSVGYRIDAYEEVKAGKSSANGRFQGPCVVATKWSPYEISIEPTPADDSVGIGRSTEQLLTEGAIITMDENETMNQQNEKTAAAPALPAVSADQIRSEAIAAERARSSEITAMCRDFGMDASEYLANGMNPDEVRSIILKKMKDEGQKPVPAANIEIVADEEEKFRSAARDGQLIRMGYQVERPADGAADFRGMSLRNLAVNCLMRAGDTGQDIMRMGDEELLKAVYGFDGSRAILQPDSSFQSIINSTMGAVLSKGYQTANTTFQLWTGTGSNPNFKVAQRYRLSASGEPVKIKQHGEFKWDSVSDEGVGTKLDTYGKKFGFTRETFVNDDLGTLAKAIVAQTRSFKRTINRQVYEVLGKNAKYPLDGKNLFHADHMNLGTPTALSVESLGGLYKLMSLQKDLSNKEQLNIQPRFGLFPVSLMMEARKVLTSTADPGSSNSGVVNPVQGLVTPIFDAELDKYSTTAHYAAADPSDVDTVEVGYYNGKAEPTLESKVSWDILGIEYRMFQDWYVQLLDFRGLAKNNGK